MGGEGAVLSFGETPGWGGEEEQHSPPYSSYCSGQVWRRERGREKMDTRLLSPSKPRGKRGAPGFVLLVSIVSAEHPASQSSFTSVSHLIPEVPLRGGRMGFLIQRRCLSHTSRTAAAKREQNRLELGPCFVGCRARGVLAGGD